MSLEVSLFKDIYSPTAFRNEVIHSTAYWNEVFEYLYYVSVKKRTIREITTLVIDGAGNPIAIRDSKTPSKVILHFRHALK